MNAVKRLYNRDVHISRLILITAAWLVFMAFSLSTKFYSVISFQTMGAQFPEFGLMSLGVMLCMITGGIDLSVVGVANLTSITMGILLKSLMDAEGAINPMAIVLAFALGIIIGALAGFLNGVLVSKVRIPPILATLGTQQLFLGIGIVLTEGKAVSRLPTEYAQMIAGKVFNAIPVQLVIFAVVAAIIGFLMLKTTYGQRIYMLGVSPRAAHFSGLKNDALLITTYTISGVCAALGGLIMLANYNSARSDYGAVYTLQCVLIVVLGGVSPSGGRGKLSGVLLSICVLQMLTSGLNRFRQLNAFLIPLIWGGILVLVMVANYFTERKKS
ncbi:MAG: ABC transporter permease [Clostridia bacterium]|nr:ABC transporter permease [Clostridia bacterium]